MTGPTEQASAKGFTLIELMIAVAVVGILAAIAYPSYREQVLRGYRSEVKTVLMENMQFLERNFTANNCYHRKDGDCATSTVDITLPVTKSPKDSAATRYNIQFATGEPTRNSFVLVAIPAGIMSGDACGTFSLNHLGVKNIKDKPPGSAKTPEECWGR